MRRALVIPALLVAAYLGYGLSVRAHRAPRPPLPPGEIHGAYHVHTSRSDGRGSLAEVVRAARQAGLQFVVVTDHNVLTPGDAGWREGVLVIEGSEVSAPYGHIVALGVSRELSKDERQKDAIGHILELGGRPVLAHPFHPRRPFTRWGKAGWTGFEVVSSDSLWGWAVKERGLGRMALALLDFPWDPARSVLDFYRYPARELARFDELNRAPGGGPGRPSHPLLCASDAHGYPSYLAAFEAFSMHLAVTPSGDASVDTRAIVDGLLDGSAVCVFDGVAPAWGVRLSPEPGGDRIRLSFSTPDPSPASFRLFRDGAPAAPLEAGPGGGTFSCGGACAGHAWRAEGTWKGRPWLFTNPLRIE